MLGSVGLLFAACGGTSGPGVASVGSSTTTTITSASQGASNGPSEAQMLKYSQCMQHHGLPNFPDPNSQGDLSIGPGNVPGGPNSPQFKAAQKDCQSLMPGALITSAEKAAANVKALAFAQRTACPRRPQLPRPERPRPDRDHPGDSRRYELSPVGQGAECLPEPEQRLRHYDAGGTRSRYRWVKATQAADHSHLRPTRRLARPRRRAPGTNSCAATPPSVNQVPRGFRQIYRRLRLTILTASVVVPGAASFARDAARKGTSRMDDRLSLQGAIRYTTDPKPVMDRIVEEALRLIPSANGALVELADGDSLSCVCGAGILARAVGMRIRLDSSLSGLGFQTGTTLRCDDSELDARADRDAFRRTGSRSAISVPLRRGRDPVGAFSVSSPALAAFDDRDVATLTGLAEFITAAITTTSELDRVTGDLLTTLDAGTMPSRADETDRVSQFVANVLHPGVANDVEAAQRIDKVLDSGEFAILFQPVVDLCSGKLVGVEALARFLPGPYRPPNEWFAEAHRVGRGVELEHAAVRAALSQLSAGSPPTATSPSTSVPRPSESPEIKAVLQAVESRRVVPRTHRALPDRRLPAIVQRVDGDIRERGVRLAIDDAGSGYSGLSHIVQIAPDIIKIDMELIRGIDFDPVRRSLVTLIVAFAPEIGASLVVEGIETRAEFETLRGLSVECGQGYFLGQPGPPELLDVYRRPASKHVRRAPKGVLSG